AGVPRDGGSDRAARQAARVIELTSMCREAARGAMEEAVQSAGYKRWMCLICGFMYDEEQGLPEEGLAPGTAWEDAPGATAWRAARSASRVAEVTRRWRGAGGGAAARAGQSAGCERCLGRTCGGVEVGEAGMRGRGGGPGNAKTPARRPTACPARGLPRAGP